jgi:hypothetical protein
MATITRTKEITYYPSIKAMDADTISRAKAQLFACKGASSDNVFYLLGGCEELIRQLIRVAERRQDGL